MQLIATQGLGEKGKRVSAFPDALTQGSHDASRHLCLGTQEEFKSTNKYHVPILDESLSEQCVYKHFRRGTAEGSHLM